jgi:hypothetical protein
MHASSNLSMPTNYPDHFLEKFSNLNDSDKDQKYSQTLKEDFNQVFEERFKDKNGPKINPERVKNVALGFGVVASVALTVAAVALAVLLFILMPAVIGSLALTGFVIPTIVLATDVAGIAIPISLAAAAVSGAVSGILYLVRKPKMDDVYNSKEYCIEQANQAISDFLTSQQPFESFYQEHKELFERDVLKVEDLNIMLRRKIKHMGSEQLKKINENSPLLFKENKELISKRMASIASEWQMHAAKFKTV